MCGKVVGTMLLAALALATGLPARDDLMLDLGDDTAVVESTVREARQAVPEHIEDLLKPGVKEAFLHTYGDKESDDGELQGYRKKYQDKGKDGYKHFDSYHKKDGDKYGFETHSEYGQENKHKIDTDGKSEKLTDEYGRGKDEGGQAESKKAYKVVEDVKADKKGVKNIEGDYEGDSGYYVDGGDSEGYNDAESENYSEGDGGESAAYTEGDGDSGNYEESSSYEEGDGDSGHYTSEDGDGESGSYTAGAEYDDGDGESQAYTAEEGDDY